MSATGRAQLASRLQLTRQTLMQSYSNKNFKTRSYSPELLSNAIFSAALGIQDIRGTKEGDLQYQIDRKAFNDFINEHDRTSAAKPPSRNNNPVSAHNYLLQKIDKILKRQDRIIERCNPVLFTQLKAERLEVEERKNDVSFRTNGQKVYAHPDTEIYLFEYKEKQYKNRIAQLEAEMLILNEEKATEHQKLASKIQYYKRELELAVEERQSMAVTRKERCGTAQPLVYHVQDTTDQKVSAAQKREHPVAEGSLRIEPLWCNKQYDKLLEGYTLSRFKAATAIPPVEENNHLGTTASEIYSFCLEKYCTYIQRLRVPTEAQPEGAYDCGK